LEDPVLLHGEDLPDPALNRGGIGDQLPPQGLHLSETFVSLYLPILDHPPQARHLLHDRNHVRIEDAFKLLKLSHLILIQAQFLLFF
jgi:hypothetical protein